MPNLNFAKNHLPDMKITIKANFRQLKLFLVTGAQEAKKAGARNSSLCETVFHLENILQSYKKSTVSPKPRFREEKNYLYIFNYNRWPDFCKHFF